MSTLPATFSFDTFDIEDSVGYLLSRAKTMLSKSIDDSLSKLGITHAQGSVFMMLALGKCSTAAELARDLFTDAAAMKRMLDRMEAKGFLTRVADSHDRRLFKLELSATGKVLAQQLPAIYAEVLCVGFTGFSNEEIGFLKSLLRKLLANRAILETHQFN